MIVEVEKPNAMDKGDTLMQLQREIKIEFVYKPVLGQPRIVCIEPTLRTTHELKLYTLRDIVFAPPPRFSGPKVSLEYPKLGYYTPQVSCHAP